jgi:hypothetical protein
VEGPHERMHSLIREGAALLRGYGPARLPPGSRVRSKFSARCLSVRGKRT